MKSRYIIIGTLCLIALAFGYQNTTAIEAVRNSSDKSLITVRVTVPKLSEEAQFGKLVFEKKCADCHGVNAAGQDQIAPPLIHKIYEPDTIRMRHFS